MKALRQAPTASGRRASSPLPSMILTWSSFTEPPQSRAMAMTCRICSPWGSSADSKPSTRMAWAPSDLRASCASPGSSRRQLAGQSLVWTIWRTASPPASKVENVTAAEAR